MPYVLSPHPGLLRAGNIDVHARPVVRLANGSIATVRSVSFRISFRGRSAEVLVPTVIGNQIVSNSAAFANYKTTGAHLGIFDTPAHATAYAVILHKEQARYYRERRRKQRS